MNGIIYCRVSSKEQVEGTSLEVQEAACRDYARSKGIAVLKVFVEEGESAKFADRTKLLELIDYCCTNKGAVQVLLVWKVDRFARNVTDHYSVKATLNKHGVRVASVTEPIDQNPEGRLMETILAGFAEFDNGIRAMRSVQGMRRKIQEGIFPWGAPFGYKSSVTSGEKKVFPDLPDRPTFDLLQRAFREFATGAYTQAEMGRRMVSWGLASSNGREFTPQSLYQLFTNRFYEGVIVDPWSGGEFSGQHTPMVTKQEFALVQQVITERNKSVPHQKDNPMFPLRGVVRCDACLHHLTGASSRGRSRLYPYYVCHSEGCLSRGKSYRAADIHEEFESFLDQIAPTNDFVEKIDAAILEEANLRQNAHGPTQTRRSERIGSLDNELRELIRMRAQSLITDEEFSRQRKTVINQRTALEAKPREGVINLAEIRSHLREIRSPLVHLRQTWKALAPQARRRFDSLVLPVGFVVTKSRTAELGLLFSAFGASAPGVSSGVPHGCVRSNRIIEEIQGIWSILQGIPEEEKIPEYRFRHSRRTKRPIC